MRALLFASAGALVLAVSGCGTDPIVVDGGGEVDAPGNIDSSRVDAPACTAASCDDGEYCNGVEECSEGACTAGTPPCSAASCDEDSDTCSCTTPDADGDGVRSMACGGADCDDDDVGRYPGATEVCDAMDVDEDCDPLTYGFRDLDMDGSPDARCCNDDGSGGENCGSDCDDMRPGVSPTAPEVCNGLNDDCDAATDEGVMETFYADGDMDGYGVDDASTNMQACFAPTGYADMAGDCLDTAASVHPGAIDSCDAAMMDEDCNGTPNDPPAGCACTGTESRPCTAMGVCAAGTELCVGGMWGSCSISPVAEVCDGRDEDCDGTVDDGTQTSCYADGDGDGYPAMGATATLLCPASGGFGGCPTGYTTRVPMGTLIDCDDATFSRSPAGTEVCNGVDDDCDSEADEMLTVTCYRDVDNDTYSAMGAGAMQQCADSSRTMVGLCPVGWTNRAPSPADCEDTNPGRSPAALELCDGADQDCDGVIDDGVAVPCYPDPDGDLYAAMGATVSQQCRDSSRMAVGYCPIGYTNAPPTASVYDCAPTNGAIHPAATEICTLPAVDEDCDGMANEASVCMCGDGTTRMCALPGRCAAGTEQCMSGMWGACSISPIAETCNMIDDDCDGTADEMLSITCYADGDNDTYAPAGASATPRCPVAGRESVGGCPVNYTNRSPATASDCDDTSSGVSPAAMEVCTDSGPAVDENCSGMVDEGLRVTCYTDGDGDTYALATAMAISRCRDPSRMSVGYCPAGYTNRVPGSGTSDCNDGQASVNPAATETCDGTDSNCSTGGGPASDEDADGDGFASTTAPCTGGFPRTDCRDTIASVYPGAPESCDRVDSNCSTGGGTALDEDADGDMHASPTAPCTGGYPRDDCYDGNANAYPGQGRYFATPYCSTGIAPTYCMGWGWYCSGGACPPVCSGCAPLDPANFDYDCSGARETAPVQNCTTTLGMACFGSVCRSGPDAAQPTSQCGRPVASHTCNCGSGPAIGSCMNSVGGSFALACH